MSLRRSTILLVGDLCLDTYTMGRVERISPEAPVPVLLQQRCEHRPGMAGNTARNLLALGQEVRLLGRIGADSAGERLRDALSSDGIETGSLITERGYTTSEKNRLIAGQQQLCRVDHEVLQPLASEEALISKFPELLEGVALCAVSDYGKGFLTPTLLKGLIQACRERSIPTVVDPKGRDFGRYRGATVVKPNVSEAVTAAGLGAEASLDQVASALLQETGVEALMVTRAEKGISLFSGEGREDFPTQVAEVRDVTGAGDTVLATVSAALASGHTLQQAAQLANRAASLAVQHIGCVAVSLGELEPVLTH